MRETMNDDPASSRWWRLLGLGVGLAGPLAVVFVIRQEDQGWMSAISVHWRVVLASIAMSAFLGVLLATRKLGQFLFVSAALALFGLAWLGKRSEQGFRTQPDSASREYAQRVSREAAQVRLLQSRS